MRIIYPYSVNDINHWMRQPFWWKTFQAGVRETGNDVFQETTSSVKHYASGWGNFMLTFLGPDKNYWYDYFLTETVGRYGWDREEGREPPQLDEDSLRRWQPTHVLDPPTKAELLGPVGWMCKLCCQGGGVWG